MPTGADAGHLRRRRWGYLTAVALLVLLGAGGCWAMRSVEQSGRRFYQTGRQVGKLLDRMAKAISESDRATLEELYGGRFRGKLLGLDQLGRSHPQRLSDGTRIYRLRPVPTGAAMPEQGAAEWSDYLGGFQEIEQVRLSLERMEDWDEEVILATVSFEMIGLPRGEASFAVDRAVLRLGFERRASGQLQLRRSSAIEGSRTIAASPATAADGTAPIPPPAFEEVGARAGIDFENRFYPRFLSEKLAFPMIRYGPGGITAADYDGDGFHDLFIPDGVESRLFRNRRDGTFEDVTAAVGLSGLSGVSVGLFADYDNDGHADLFVSRTFEPNQLFHNDGDGAFTDVTASSGIGADCCTTVASWADYDLDGDLDLYVGRYLDPRRSIPTTLYARNGEPNRLYRNEGDGTFTEVAEAAGVAEIGLCLGTAFGDYDDDGDPDLYVVNDFGRNTLYRNDRAKHGAGGAGGADGAGAGAVRFTDVTVETGTLAYGAGMSAAFADYDNDGDLDLYVANIRSEEAWFADLPTVRLLMLNALRQGTWRAALPLFREIQRQSGRDFVALFRQMSSGNTLLRNLGSEHNRGTGTLVPTEAGGEEELPGPVAPATFADATLEAHANPFGWFWGSTFGDFDNDGWQDLYSANGWIYNQRDTEIELDFLHNVVTRQREYARGTFFDPDTFENRSWHGWERNRHLHNLGDGTFHEIGRAVGSDLLRNSRGIALADFENRGVLDIAVAASGDRHALLRNRSITGRHWLAVDLMGAGARLPDGTNRDAVGARLTLRAGGMTQTREIVLGDGYGSQNALRAHFGLGRAVRVEELTVYWPRSGREQRFHDLAADRLLLIEEGVDAITERPVGSATAGKAEERASDGR